MSTKSAPMLLATAAWHTPSRTALQSLQAVGVDVRGIEEDAEHSDTLRKAGARGPGYLLFPDGGIAPPSTIDRLNVLGGRVQRPVTDAAGIGAISVLYDYRRGVSSVWRELTPAEKTTLLCCAAALGAENVARYCIGKLRDHLSQTDALPGGNTALHYAALSGHHSIASMLLRCGADPVAQNPVRTQPMHDAARSGSIETLAVLREYGADLTEVNAYGDTLLHRAAEYVQADRVAGYLKIYEMCREFVLERFGKVALTAFLDQCNHKGFTALDMAVVRGQDAFADQLREDGATHGERWCSLSGDERTYEHLNHSIEWNVARQALQI
jgi:hypothetical protein